MVGTKQWRIQDLVKAKGFHLKLNFLKYIYLIDIIYIELQCQINNLHKWEGGLNFENRIKKKS